MSAEKNRILNAHLSSVCALSLYISTCLCLQFLQLLVRLPLRFGIGMDGLFTALDCCLGILLGFKKSDEEARNVDDEQTSKEKRRAIENAKERKKNTQKNSVREPHIAT